MTDPSPIPDWVVREDVQDWARTVSLLDVLIWAAGAILAVVALRWVVRSGWPRLQAAARGVIRVNAIFDIIVALPERIEQIHHETHHNNGTSLKDSAVRTEKNVEDLSAQLVEVIERLDRIDPQPKEKD